MSETGTSGLEAEISGSQLSTFRRLHLLIRNPRDAFALLCPAERKKDAMLVFVLYLTIRIPIHFQKAWVTGKMDKYPTDSGLGIVAAVLGAVVISIIILFLSAFFLQLVIRFYARATSSLTDTVIMLALCHAPTLLLIFELPNLAWHFNDYTTFSGMLPLRLVVSIMSMRMVYWGLRTIFAVTKRKALAITLTPVVLIVVLVFMIAAA